jgi:hypothetical protein
MIIYSKSYDFTNKLLINLKISKVIYSNNVSIPFKNFELSLLLKKEMIQTKNKLVLTVTSMLFLIAGVYPLYRIKNYKKFALYEYAFKWNSDKIFFLLDIMIFIMYHFMSKRHEIVRKIKGGERYEIHFFHMYNIVMLRAFDPHLSLFPDTNIITKITSSTSDTKDIKLVETVFRT